MKFTALQIIALFIGGLASADCSRIVSLAPSATETLFAVGLGENVVGVTRFCSYPPEAKNRAVVGGLLDLSLEAVAAQQPSLVVYLREQEESAVKLRALGKRTLRFDHSHISGILDSITQLGSTCGQVSQANELRSSIEQSVEKLKRQLQGRPLARVLVTVGRGDEESPSSGVFASGNDGYLGDLVALAGGKNINDGTTVGFPLLSPEALVTADPEVIIEIVDPRVSARVSESAVRSAWAAYPTLSAVKSGRIFVLADDFASIPGPRFIQLLERFVVLIHPEVAHD